MKKILILMSLSVFLGSSLAAGVQRESLIAGHIGKIGTTAETVWLNEPDNRFLALYRKPTTPLTHGGVILLHDREKHPAEEAIINLLASDLPKRGWETLAIQLPLAYLTDSFLHVEANARIQAGIDFFGSRQNRNLIIIGHGLGARMGLATLEKNPQPLVRAFVAIGMTANSTAVPDPAPETIGRSKIPVLDIIGSRDHLAVIRAAELRRAHLTRTGVNDYRQDLVTGADHEFRGLGDSLLHRIAGWLGKVAAGTETETLNLSNPPASMP